MDTLELTWRTEGGIEGIDADPNNPLSRALRRLLEQGQPLRRIVLCFCTDRQRQDIAPIRRWFGVFVLSAGGRVIFFPGFRYSKAEGIRGKSLMWKEKFDFDHISLEKGFQSWHITNRNSKRQLGGPRTTALGEQRFLWCGLSLASLTELREVKQQTRISVQVPEGDTRRRSDILINARKNAIFPILEFDNPILEQSPEGIWHFRLIIAPPKSPTYQGDKWGFPEGSPYLREPLPEGHRELFARHHRLELSSEIALQITTVFLQGSLNTPITFSAPFE